MMVDIANKIFALGTIAGQVAVGLGCIYLLFFRKKQTMVGQFFANYGLLFAFMVALASTLGSLFYSEIVGFPPCDLCWLQRFFMYPQIIMLGFLLVKKNQNANYPDSRILHLALGVSLVGALVSVFHNYLYYDKGGLAALCQLGGSSVSCIKRYVFEFGYVTIPMMSLTAFALIVMFLVLYKLRKKI